MKINIASMKSECNVKINKISTEIKELKLRNRNLQPKEDVAVLRRELEALQHRKEEVTEEPQVKTQTNRPPNKESTFSHLDSSDDEEAHVEPPIPRTRQPVLLESE
jgi:uncharacterized protein YceH (UPF0502 family)